MASAAHFIDDVVEPTAETPGTEGAEEEMAVIATVETNLCTRGLRRVRHHNDLVAVMRVGQSRYGSGLPASSQGARQGTLPGLRVVPMGTLSDRHRDREVRGMTGASECETLLEPRSRSTEYNEGVRPPNIA